MEIRNLSLLNKKKTTLTLLLFLPFIALFSQIPTGYYDSAIGKKGNALYITLHEIIDNHNVQGYGDLWEHFYHTDRKENGKIWDIYSDIPNGTPPYEYTYSEDQCGRYDDEGMCYNREHSVPASWFDDQSPMYTDLFHLYPTDGWVNNKRGNYPFGEVGTASWTSENGSKLGANSYPGYSGQVFEPIDDYKGDLARSYFYMSTRYVGKTLSFANGSAMFSGSTLKAWAVKMLIEWHENDTVSQKEINRNNAIYRIQNNRNPYIDYPELVGKIFGADSINPFNPDSIPVEPDFITELIGSLPCQIAPNPAIDKILISHLSSPIQSIMLYNLQGRVILHRESIGEHTVELQLNEIPAGLYFLQIFLDKGVEIHKIVKQQ